MGKWEEVKLGDGKVTELIMGQSPPSNTYNREKIGLPFYQGKKEFGELYPTVEKWCSKPNKIAESGDVLLSVRAPVGPTNLAFEKCCIGRGLASIRPNLDLIETKFLLYYFQNFELEISSKGQGSTFKAISGKELRNLQIPLPPLPEQQRIVAKLDGLFAKIDKAIGLLEANILHTQALMGSVLDEEFGKLEKLSTKYDKLKNLTKKIGSGSTPRGGQSSYKESGISLIRSMNVHDCYFKVKNLAFIDDIQADKLKNVEIQENDVLLNITGASVARCCIVDSNYLPARVNQHVSIIRTDERILPEFMLYFLISPKMKSKLLYDSSGNATREAITKSMIEAIDVPIISLEIQQKLINKIKESFRLNNKIIETQTQKLTHLKALKSSLLDQAFKGEL
ncbi:restriction endonuclease subunit S [Winogradskyella undariae]|uniref:restriction endonuclease subunit S n=1 Tax=Winogradskyella undariae TaxID=1285465 RepID=UPI00156BD333|nr:restriction endonuclease subunit S [Winogradskyella undariae]NRR92389.1 restriction endonuclease subunit S [Winogradskyella undariae]